MRKKTDFLKRWRLLVYDLGFNTSLNFHLLIFFLLLFLFFLIQCLWITGHTVTQMLLVFLKCAGIFQGVRTIGLVTKAYVQKVVLHLLFQSSPPYSIPLTSGVNLSLQISCQQNSVKDWKFIKITIYQRPL